MPAIIATMQARRATSAAWAAANPVLKAGEIGYDTTTDTFRVGDGSTAWILLKTRGHASSQLSDATAAGVAMFTAASAAAQRTLLNLPYAVIGTWAAVSGFSAAGLVQGDKALVTDIGTGAGSEVVWNGSSWQAVGDVVLFRSGSLLTPTASTLEQLVCAVPLRPAFLLSGSVLSIAALGRQTNTTTASTTTYRLRLDTVATGVSGTQLGLCTITNGTTTRSNAPLSVDASAAYDGSAMRGAITQEISAPATNNSAGQTTSVIPGSSTFLKLTVQHSSATATRTFQSIVASLAR